MKKYKHTLFLFTLLIAMFMLHTHSVESYLAATSYTNAKEFYHSTATNGEPYHTEVLNGSIYYATCAKLAVSTTNLRYHTIGFDITLTGNDTSLTFTVQRNGGSMTEIDSRQDDTYEYILYVMDDKTLYHLAHSVDDQKADTILSDSIIDVRMDAILATVTGSSMNGGITEDEAGGFTSWGTIYRLSDTNHLAVLKSIFTGHKFESYYNMKEKLNNYQLQLRYNVQGLEASSTTATVGNNYSIINDYLAKSDVTYIQSSHILQKLKLVKPNTIKLKKSGYHLPEKEEWITRDGRIFDGSDTYMPQEIEPLTGTQNKGLTMYANWIPNNYTIKYDANGGDGNVLPSDFTFDKAQTLRENTFTRLGHTLKPNAEWNTRKDGEGTDYNTKSKVKNLTSKADDTITLYANWEPIVAEITLDKQGGSVGTDMLYEKYMHDFYSEKSCSTILSRVILPEKEGHTCQGYYTELLGNGKQIIDKSGIIQIDNTYYTENDIIYAHYTPNIYDIQFDKQGGLPEVGSSSVSATYGEYFPKAESPIRKGYSFKGYYELKNGSGTRYYNEHMACDKRYLFTTNLTLFAHWEDDILPTIRLTADYGTSGNWTKQVITLTVDAKDDGDGLSSLSLYRIEATQSETLVMQNNQLNGTNHHILTYQNHVEGAVRYKAIVTDTHNRTAEVWLTVYYDKTAPTIRLNHSDLNPSALTFDLDVSDINTR